MPNEETLSILQRPQDPRGSTRDVEGVPYDETLSRREVRRLEFERYIAHTKPGDLAPAQPVQPVPKPTGK